MSWKGSSGVVGGGWVRSSDSTLPMPAPNHGPTRIRRGLTFDPLSVGASSSFPERPVPDLVHATGKAASQINQMAWLHLHTPHSPLYVSLFLIRVFRNC